MKKIKVTAAQLQNCPQGCQVRVLVQGAQGLYWQVYSKRGKVYRAPDRKTAQAMVDQQGWILLPNP